MKGRNRKQINQGFTLVELMIAVLILGILIGIAVPLFNKSNDFTSETACFANQKTINQASLRWRMENGTSDQAYPPDVRQLAEDGYILEVPSCGGYAFTEIDPVTGLTSCPDGGKHVLSR